MASTDQTLKRESTFLKKELIFSSNFSLELMLKRMTYFLFHTLIDLGWAILIQVYLQTVSEQLLQTQKVTFTIVETFMLGKCLKRGTLSSCD